MLRYFGVGEQGVLGNIYAAHINALDALCKTRASWQMGSPHAFGIVLEGDARVPQRTRTMDLPRIVRSHPNTTVFNLGPSNRAFVRDARRRALVAGRCFASASLGDWGTVAVGWNLQRACSSSVASTHRRWLGCIPADVGLYFLSGGDHALVATVPFFEVPTAPAVASAHGDDGVHRHLASEYASAEAAWRSSPALQRCDDQQVLRNVARPTGPIHAAVLARPHSREWVGTAPVLHHQGSFQRSHACSNLSAAPSWAPAPALVEWLRSTTALVLTSYMTALPDPQRKRVHVRADCHAYLARFTRTAAAHGLRTLILHDSLSASFTAGYEAAGLALRFQRVNVSGCLSNNDERLLAYRTLLAAAPTSLTHVLFSDLSDAFFNAHPLAPLRSVSADVFMVRDADYNRTGKVRYFNSARQWMSRLAARCWRHGHAQELAATLPALWNAGVWAATRSAALRVLECTTADLAAIGSLRPRQNCNTLSLLACLNALQAQGELIVAANEPGAGADVVHENFSNPYWRRCGDARFHVIHDKCEGPGALSHGARECSLDSP